MQPRDPGEPVSERLLAGIDVGGTKVMGVLVQPGAVAVPQTVASMEIPWRTGGAEVIDRVLETADNLVELARPGSLASIGIGLAGLVGRDGVVLRSPNVPGLEGVDLVARLRAETGLPVFVGNDANCVATAARSLRGAPTDDLVAVTFGTGIGAGFIVDGRLLRGNRGFAGEPGHMVVDPRGPLCPCGQRGCWERFAAGSALEALADRAVAAGRMAPLDPELGTGLALVRASEAGVLAAAEVLEEFAGWVALGLANLVNLLDPAVVVLGGGVTAAGDAFLEPVRAGLRRHPLAAVHSVAVELAPGGPEAGAVGAALLASEAVA